MKKYGKQFWRSVPFLRLLLPLVSGIVLSHYYTFPLWAMVAPLIISLTFLFLLRARYHLRWINGSAINLVFICTGCLVMHFQNISNDKNWIGHYEKEATAISLILQEPLTAKKNSYRSLANATAVLINHQWKPVKGNIILYFKKDSIATSLQYGSQLLVHKRLQPITGTGNPGGFDYKQYCAFQNIYHQVYLQPGDYFVRSEVSKNDLTELLINTRNHVLSVFRKWVPGEVEMGVAEALLIGYRDDLDKDLVRAYSNTGVVHIIAISGLHLGMIYGLMLLLLKPFRKQKWIGWVKPVLVLFVLWGFSLLAGAAASILRSVVMFSFIVIGEGLGRKTNIYNTLAASAFCLLIYDPYFFWDVGFQLSYTAVLSIVAFMKPVYRKLYFRNKLLNSIWQLNAITLAAQVLTLPVILYYFHQFPNLFLFTNFIAVPLSGFILYGELLLLAVCKIPLLNFYTGKFVSFLIAQLNAVIERTDRLPFAVTGDIPFSLLQVVILYIAVAYITWWLFHKKMAGLLAALACICVLFLVRGILFVLQSHQQKIIVYNIPKTSAIDVVNGHDFYFIGDAALRMDRSLQSAHLQPSRILNGVRENGKPGNIIQQRLITGQKKSVLLIDGFVRLIPVTQKIPVDIIVITGNPAIRLPQLAAVFDCPQYLFDNSNPLWKIRYWKKDADSLHLRHHTISEQGGIEIEL